MSTAMPIKFRCFRCNRLLGVSATKAGAVVACPHCAAELIVPGTDDEPEADLAAAATAASVVTPKDAASSRIAPAVVPWDAPGADREVTPDGDSAAGSAFPALRIDPEPLRSEPAARGYSKPRPGPPPEEPIVMPAIAMTPPTLREEATPRTPSGGLGRRDVPRRDDVVLPRAAVILWSFVVLIGLVSAFGAGLLAGRFLWAPGVPIAAGPAGRK